MSQLRRLAPTAGGLVLTVLLATTAGLIVVFAAAWFIGQQLIGTGLASDTGDRTGTNPSEVLALLAYLAVSGVAGARYARSTPLPGPVPTTVMVVGAGAVTLLAHRLVWYAPAPGGGRLAAACIGLWVAGAAALVPAVARIARAGRTRIAWLVGGAGGVLVADLAFTAALWLAVPASEAQRAYAPAWLPVSLGMNELGLPSGFQGPGAQDAFGLLQYPLIGVTAFAVALAVAHGRRPATG